MLTPYVSASPSLQLDRKGTASEVLGLWATSILKRSQCNLKAS